MSTPACSKHKMGPLGTAVFVTALHVTISLILLGFYIQSGAKAKRAFEEFGFTPQWFVGGVVHFAAWLVDYWWSLVPVFGFLTAGDFVLARRLSQRDQRLRLALLTSGVTLLLATIGIGSLLVINEGIHALLWSW